MYEFALLKSCVVTKLDVGGIDDNAVAIRSAIAILSRTQGSTRHIDYWLKDKENMNLRRLDIIESMDQLEQTLYTVAKITFTDEPVNREYDPLNIETYLKGDSLLITRSWGSYSINLPPVEPYSKGRKRLYDTFTTALTNPDVTVQELGMLIRFIFKQQEID